MKTLIIAAILSFAVPVMAQQEYYQWDGNSLLKLSGPQSVTPDHWAIWVFGDGVDAVPGKQWGEVDGKTPDEAQQKWEAQVKFEQTWKKFSGITSDPAGYENHLGPIAIMKPVAQAGNSQYDNASQQVEDLCKRQITDFASVDNVINAYKKYQGLYYQDQPGGLYLHVDNELLDYLNDLHDLVGKVNGLREHLNNMDGPALDSLQAQIDAMNQSLSSIETHGQTLANKFQTQNKPNYSSGDTSWSGKVYHEAGTDTTGKVTLDGSDINLKTYHGADLVWNSTTSLTNVVSAEMYQPGIVKLDTKSRFSDDSVYLPFDNPDDANKCLQYVTNHIVTPSQ